MLLQAQSFDKLCQRTSLHSFTGMFSPKPKDFALAGDREEMGRSFEAMCNILSSKLCYLFASMNTI